MSTTPRLSRSIPFWVLVGGSVVALAGGVFLLVSRLSAMDAGLTDQTATTSDVYVGQIWAVAGAVLAGAGLVGLALALTVGALGSLAKPAVEFVEAPVWEDEVEVAADAEPVVVADDPEVTTPPAR